MKWWRLLFIKQFQIKLSPQNVAPDHLSPFYTLTVLTCTHTRAYLLVYTKCTNYFYSFWTIHCVQSLAYEMDDRRVVVRFSASYILFSTVIEIDVRRIQCPKQ